MNSDQSFLEEANISQESEAITIEDQSMNDLERLMTVNIDSSSSYPEVEDVQSSSLIKLDIRSLGLTFEDLVSTYNLADSSTCLDSSIKKPSLLNDSPKSHYLTNYR